MTSNSTDEVASRPYVLALSIVHSLQTSVGQKNDEQEVLYCVRNPSVNLTHPNVVSVPTQRIPEALGDELRTRGTVCGSFGDTQLITSAIVSNGDCNGHDSMVYVVESLLAGKMGMAEHLESDDLRFTVQLAGFHHGRAQYEKGTGENPDVDDDEELRMVNLLVNIEKGADLFPTETTSYRIMSWTPTENFKKMWKDNDTTQIGLPKSLDIWACVQGLCIASTFDILSADRP